MRWRSLLTTVWAVALWNAGAGCRFHSKEDMSTREQKEQRRTTNEFRQASTGHASQAVDCRKVVCPGSIREFSACYACGGVWVGVAILLEGSMDVVSGVWKRAGIDKGQLAKCVAGVVPEAAEHRGESYIAIKIHMDIRKGGEIAVATLELDGRLSSSEGRATWPQIHSPTAKCVDAVLSPARLHMEAAPVTATLAVEVAKYENEPIPDFLLPRKTGTGAVPAGVAVPEESRKGSWRQSERDSGGNPRVAVPEES